MGHGTSDAVMDFVTVSTTQISFRLGVEFRRPDQSPPPLESLLPARYLRIQVASPPPDRVDGSFWYSGLWVRDGSPNGRPFDRDDPSWRTSGGVFPLGGTSPLAQPAPETLIYDRWVTASAVAPTEAITRCFELVPSNQPSGGSLNHFISVPYPTPSIGGQELSLAGVRYYYEGTLDMARPIEGYCAVCLGQFYPPERASAEYIVAVDTNLSTLSNGAPSFPITKAY